MEDGSKAVGLFNRSGRLQEISACWKDLKIKGNQKIRDFGDRKTWENLKMQFKSEVSFSWSVLIRFVPRDTAEIHR